MISDERKQQILTLLEQHGTVRVTELSRLFRVSEVTIRNYLSDMEGKGLLTRTHGGAISSYKPYYSMNFSQRLKTNQEEKDRIAQAIAARIRPSDTVMLNAGTTTLLAFRHLPADCPLNIVTNSVAIALEAAANPNFNVVLVGGAVHAKYQFTYGDEAIAQLRNYHADKLILSVDGVDPDGGFSTYYSEEVPIDRAMIEQSDVRIVAADRSKLRRRAFARIAELSAADFLVTTGEFSREEEAVLRDSGITVTCVG